MSSFYKSKSIYLIRRIVKEGNLEPMSLLELRKNANIKSLHP